MDDKESRTDDNGNKTCNIVSTSTDNMKPIKDIPEDRFEVESVIVIDLRL